MSSLLEGMEHQLKDAKNARDKLASITRLLKNPDFRKVIMDGWTKEEAARYVQASVNILLSEEDRADALANAQATGYFKTWLQQTIKELEMKVASIPECEEALEEERAIADSVAEEGDE